ncbi:FliC/FljB family flagellin [Chromohalobacter sp. HP20-39]|uniref:FliC/FljB family flagellin n=1 Tax=Chromohalobacter sp. HP20-39 TaxID=3079306 RepID=UPI00294B2760|nr:FliC/FljB family flagellin [Chromohalobacter sp. HP20-39]MDV6319142.1 FliC/FljB family flagellin [Chromohalobacter sp. HP20-39]
MAVINTNITSMIAQQNLTESKSGLTTAMERLSSGLRINSAADDAAGQAIANRMSSQITGLGQAQRNANDGISVAQTTEGALNQVNDNLQRVRELTVQAANGTNSQEDLNSIQNEIGQRLAEIDRISEETSFNGVNVLAKDQEMSIQVGSEDGQTITMNLQEVNSETLNLGSFNVSGPSGGTGANTAAMAAELGIDDASYSASVGPTDAATAIANAASAATGSVDVEGFTADTGTAALVMDQEGNFFVQGTTSDGTAYVSVDITANTNESGQVTGMNVSTGDTAVGARSENPLASLDSAISDIDSQRSELGAMQNRFDSAITNLSTTETNLTSARSRIEDADYATEVASMTKNQILQQAGTSVLAQANQLPQSALSLLG